MLELHRSTERPGDPPRSGRRPELPGPLVVLGSRVGLVVDRLLAVAVVAFAVWTAWYELALAQLVPGVLAAVLALVTTVVLVVPVWRLARAVPPGPGAATWVAVSAAVVLAGVTAVVSRPDLDDAAFVTRSTWIAGTGRITDRDTMFSDGMWPGLNGQSPYVPSVEALVGFLARASGVSVGSLVYVVLPPLAAAVAAWTLWLLLRSWGARRPAWSLVLVCVFLLLGGATPASFGTYELTRIWQGKAFFLAAVVPLLYACGTAYWRAGTRSGRLVMLAAAGLLGIAAVGLTTSATFVVPAIAVVAAVPGLLSRRWVRSGALVVVMSAAPVAAAFASVLVRGAVSLTAEPLGATEIPWVKVLGTGLPALVAALAAALAVAGAIAPARWATADPPPARVTAAATGLVGAALCVPWVPHLVSAVLGTTAVSWRLAWVVPVPVLVGLVASLPARHRGAPLALVAPLVVVALAVGGIPLWDGRNGAAVQSPLAWKVYPEDLRAAEWVVREDPAGRLLAPVRIVSSVRTLTHTVLAVGGRDDHMATLDTLPDSHAPLRRALQRVAEGTPAAGDLATVPLALERLDVAIVCGVWMSPETRALLADAGYVERYLDGPYLCAVRAPASTRP